MKKKFFLVFTVLLFALLASWVQAEEKPIVPPNVEMWNPILGSEDRVILNDDYQSGLVQRYYLDPNSRYGIGRVVWAFYKDGSEEILYKGWMLGTEQAQEAMLLKDGSWFVKPPSKIDPPTLSIKILRTAFEKTSAFTDGRLLVTGTRQILVDADRNTLAARPVYFNKNSAHDPDPIETETKK